LAISDEGSGQWIGRMAVSAVLGAKDAGDDPPLLATILNLWKLSSLDELVRRANGSPPPDFSSLFRCVVEAASAGDSLARQLLEEAGAELSALARNVIRRLFADGASVPVAISGGVFRQSEAIRQVFYDKVTGEFPRANIQTVVVDPVRGALELARKASKR
jgi:N-acetylglucosamine kinase-like BadF-type ATPase